MPASIQAKFQGKIRRTKKKRLDILAKRYRIYALITSSNEIFYVGKTVSHPNIRVRGHFSKQTNPGMRSIIKTYKESKSFPFYFTLERDLTEYEAFFLEKHWIEKFIDLNIPITNKLIPAFRKQRGCSDIIVAASHHTLSEIFTKKIQADYTYGAPYLD